VPTQRLRYTEHSGKPRTAVISTSHTSGTSEPSLPGQTPDGTMPERLRAFDWTAAALEPPASWPPALRAALSLCLRAAVPTALYMGPDLRLFYNDAWAPFLGERHPGSLGLPAREVWADQWQVLGPQIGQALADGRAVAVVDQVLTIHRAGASHETCWSYSCTPIADDEGIVAGVLHQAHDTTAQVTGDRQLRAHAARQAFLVELGDRLRNLADPRDVMAMAASLLGQHLCADRAGYALIDATGASFEVERDWCSPGMSSLAGRHRLEAFGPALIAELRAGRSVAFADAQSDPLTTGPVAAASYHAADVRAAMTMPLVRSGRFVTALFVHQREPRRWTPEEQALAEQVAERTWDSVERARSEAALRASEQFVRRVLDNLFVFVGVTTPDGTLIEANRAVLDAVGRTQADVIGRTLWDCGWWHDAPAAQAQLREAIGQALDGRVARFDVQVRGAGDALRWVDFQLSPMRDADGTVTHLIPSAVDITERRGAEMQLRVSEARLRRIADSGIVGVLYWDLDGRVLDANDAFLELVGYARADLEAGAIDWKAITPPEWAWTDEQAVMQLRTTGTMEPFEKEYVRRDGTRVPVLIAAASFEGEAHRGITLVQNLTMRKEAERALHEADRRKDEFLATLAHELRNPLAPMRSAVHLLNVTGSEDPFQRKALDILDRQVRHMARLLDDLLDVSRITQGRLTLQKTPLTIATVVDHVVEAAQPIMQLHGHALEVRLPDRPVHLLADPVRMSQLLLNILNNAAKYTPKGGHIDLSADVEGTELVLRIRDNGAGIAPDELEHIFELFTQGRRPQHGDHGGLGIGLSLARNLARLHGGDVHARSEGPGRGSEFVVRLPLLRSEDHAGVSVGIPDPPACRRRLRLLVADDNRDAAESLGMLLEAAGHQVHAVHDGLAAWRAADSLRPDAVLLDIGMPHLDGYEVARRIRSQPWGPEMQLIAVTGWGQADDKRRAREAGFDEHLTKPIDPAALLTLLDRRA
jgi:PAS domain S-box-containing protein